PERRLGLVAERQRGYRLPRRWPCNGTTIGARPCLRVVPHAGPFFLQKWRVALRLQSSRQRTSRADEANGRGAMKLWRRRLLRLAAGAAALPVVSRFAWAQAYPTRPGRIVGGFPPGGGTGTIARPIGRGLSERLG